MAVDFKKYGLTPHGPHPSPRQVTWYQRERTVFFHFGMKTYTNQELSDGTESIDTFAATEVDCRGWVKAARDAGFKVAILTAKHHDGLCLWPTAYTDHNISNCAYKNGQGDIVKEFTDACHEFGMGVGIYLSPCDRHEASWPSDAYNDFYCGQLRELLDGRYGPIDEVWWDGAGSEQCRYDIGRWSCIIRDLQPQAVIFGGCSHYPCTDVRWVGNEGGYAGVPCWGTITGGPGTSNTIAALNHGEKDGNVFMPAECDVSIRPGWFYHPSQDGEVKSVSWLVQYWFDSVGKNGGMLLNLPPMPNGQVHQTDANNCREAYRILCQLFAFNLAIGATVEATSARTGCEAEMLLVDDPERFYAAAEGDTTPTVTLSLPQPRRINCFRVGEMIELGHRVRGFAVEACVDGRWHPLFIGECIGYLWADHFPTVTAEAVRLRITEADCAPVLREFGVYYGLEELTASQEASTDATVDLATKPGAGITVDGGITVVSLGGIYPYDTVIFDGLDAAYYTIQAFNGTTWDTVATGVPTGRTTVTFNRVRDSFQLQIVLTGGTPGDIHPEVYCRG